MNKIFNVQLTERLFSTAVILSILLTGTKMFGQTCPDCTTGEIKLVEEINSKYLGISGKNPDVPSTYNSIGKTKFNGGAWGVLNIYTDANWYPIREEKQTLCGKINTFGVSNYGDESDWNINILPNESFGDLVSDAVAKFTINDAWYTTTNGKVLIEAEITPDEHRYGNPWFNNAEHKTYLINHEICVYGPFVAEYAHGLRPEIHPCEQIWWKENENSYKVLLVNDDSNRFNDEGDFYTTKSNSKVWAPENGLEAELSIPFEIKPTEGSLYFSIQALDDYNICTTKSFQDAGSGNKSIVNCFGYPVVTVEEASGLDPFVGITFKSICYNKIKKTVQGLIIIKTAVGNGDRQEGFVALQIDKIYSRLDENIGIMVGDISDSWKTHDSIYDMEVPFSDIISSDKDGRGIVDGMIDFNGNGKTDLFATIDGAWKVLYDGKGKWVTINTSKVPKKDLRFGDVDGDGITDILHVSGHKVKVSYNGTKEWEVLTDAGEQTDDIRLGDFNGDNKTDIVYMKFMYGSPNVQPVKFVYNMYIKFGCTGPWRELNNGYELRSKEDYEKNFRFGNFNGDDITDIFRYNNNNFWVYYNGAGDYKILNKEIPKALKTEDLLFVDRLTTDKYTDIIYVDRVLHKWTVYHGGKAGTLPLSIRNNDPKNVFFGDLDNDAAWEPFALESVKQPTSAVEMVKLPKSISEPVTIAQYEKGSLRRIDAGNTSKLIMNMNLTYYPGSSNARKNINDFKGEVKVKGKSNGQFLLFNPEEEVLGEFKTLGKIKDVPLDGKNKNDIEIKFTGIERPLDIEIPAYAIGAFPVNIKKTVNGEGRWEAWKKYLKPNSKPDFSALLENPLTKIEKIIKVEMEIAPFYSSVEDGQVSSVEMGDALKELNEIAHGTDLTKILNTFGDSTPFNIQWSFELTNISTGKKLPTPTPRTSSGKWENSKITYDFPAENNLMEFKAIANISDKLGNSSIKPVEFVYYNQHIQLSKPKEQFKRWLEPIKVFGTKNYKRLQLKADYFLTDKILDPLELRSLLN